MTYCFVCRERKPCDPAYCGRNVVWVCSSCWEETRGKASSETAS